VVIRDGRTTTVDLTILVPGDVVQLRPGDVVPADILLLNVTGRACDEPVLTGESLLVDRTANPVRAGTPLAELSGCALMGRVVKHRRRPRGRGGHRCLHRVRQPRRGAEHHQLDAEFQARTADGPPQRPRVARRPPRSRWSAGRPVVSATVRCRVRFVPLAQAAGLGTEAGRARDTGAMVEEHARDRAIYQALKAVDEVAAALQTHLIEEHQADPERAASASTSTNSLRLLRQARERLGEGLRSIEADAIAQSDEISLRSK